MVVMRWEAKACRSPSRASALLASSCDTSDMFCFKPQFAAVWWRLLSCVLMLASGEAVRGQTQTGTEAPSTGASETSEPAVTFFRHADQNRWWVSGQMNYIFQAHGDFPAKYSGPNSLSAKSETAFSRLMSLYLGVELTKTTEITVTVESAGGTGISSALGLGGVTNVDVVRNPTLGSTPYLGRAVIRQTIALGKNQKLVDGGRSFLSLAPEVPERRLELRFGKLGMVDFFDNNGVGSDSHYQFTNWTTAQNGAYDFAADTRGYTIAFIATYFSPKWVVRFGEALMPKVANGIDLDYNLTRARAENYEVELHREPWKGHTSILRLLSYVNHANMGDYRQAVQSFESGVDAKADVTAHRAQGRIKYGFGVNAEQILTRDMRGFARWGWNEGRYESFAYTEVNETRALGADYAGTSWHRKQDKAGVAFVTNGISKDHQNYLKVGGSGFLLGDGTLNYSRETILETYYNAHLWRGLFGAAGVQHVWNPGYNRDRGPVTVPTLRLHVEF